MSDYKPELLTHPKRSRRKRARSKNFLTWVFAGTIIVVITFVTLVYTYYSTRAGLINIDVVKEMPQASILYDYQGHPFSRFFDENRIALPADQPVPKLLGEAVVATEDRRFYNHGGIDPIGIARAFVVNLVHRGGRQGGSTITQQLARNSIGQMQRTYDRKFLEIFLAHRIELRLHEGANSPLLPRPDLFRPGPLRRGDDRQRLLRRPRGQAQPRPVRARSPA